MDNDEIATLILVITSAVFVIIGGLIWIHPSAPVT